MPTKYYDGYPSSGSGFDENDATSVAKDLITKVSLLDRRLKLPLFVQEGETREKRTNIRRPSSTLSSDKKKSKISSLVPSKKNSIDQGLVRAVNDKFHFKPFIGMPLQCNVSGKSTQMRGTLQYLGHIQNLPKRSNIVVAGLELEQTEDLATDGSFLGKRYFTAPAKRGYFVPFKNCIKNR